MGIKYSEANRDVVKSELTIAAQDMTAAIAEVAGAIGVSVGDNLHTPSKRFEVDRALQQIFDVLREDQWPEGPAATTFGYLLAVPATKGQVVRGNAAQIAAATLTENSILVSYGSLFGAGPGSSHQYSVAFNRIRDVIRQSLSG